LLDVARAAIEPEHPCGQPGAEVEDADVRGGRGAVVVAVDQQAFRHVESAGIGEHLVVVGISAVTVVSDLVFAVGDIGDSAWLALEDDVGLDLDALVGV
jgi:H2-forming N5,N10-methylenetetrahydromethanopterin dehydrogenase-like enzyme